MTLYTAAHVRNWLLGVHLMLHYLAMVYQPGIEDLKLTEFSRGFSSERSELIKRVARVSEGRPSEELQNINPIRRGEILIR